MATTTPAWMQRINFTPSSLGDYTANKTSFMNRYAQANPYSGMMGDPNYNSAFMEMSGGGNADTQRTAENEYGQYSQSMMDAWRGTLTPDELSQYDTMKEDDYTKKQRMGQMAFLAAAGAMAAPGILGAMGATSAGAGETAVGGLGMFGEGFPAITSFADIGAGAGGSGGLMGTEFLGGLGTFGGAMEGVGTAAGLGTAASGASPWGDFLKSLGTKVGGNFLSNLVAAGGNAYMGNKNANMYDNYINQINSLFAPDSPYAKQMQQAMARKDAAAGRNSQYGTRAVELAAALTRDKANALTSPGFQNMLGQYGTNSNSVVNGFLAALGSQGGQNLITTAGGQAGNWLSRLFGNSGDKVSPTTPNVDSSWMPDWMAAVGD